MISLIIPTTSQNKKYTENIISNIRSLYDESVVEIIVEENDSVTLGDNYNNAVTRASGEKIILLHNDMLISPGFVEKMDEHIQPNRITTYTRIEPPIYNDSYPGKIILDCGDDINTFNFNQFKKFTPTYELIDGGSQLFFGCMKNDYIGIDGKTFKMFCEDDDVHRRYQLLGFERKVSCATVYHFVSKTSRTSNNYQLIEYNSNRNFIRKWGSRNSLHKYNIHAVIHNCNYQILELLEPWFSGIYCKCTNNFQWEIYCEKEQPNTKFDLRSRVKNIEDLNMEHVDVLLEFDANRFTQNSFKIIENLSDILTGSGEIGEFQLDCFRITITNLRTYERELIKL
jgi:GT2 family glycosyltransferase